MKKIKILMNSVSRSGTSGSMKKPEKISSRPSLSSTPNITPVATVRKVKSDFHLKSVINEAID
jgi:hypothetical protein